MGNVYIHVSDGSNTLWIDIADDILKDVLHNFSEGIYYMKGSCSDPIKSDELNSLDEGISFALKLLNLD